MNTPAPDRTPRGPKVLVAGLAFALVGSVLPLKAGGARPAHPGPRTSPPVDTLHLATLQQRARTTDPRSSEAGIRREATGLTLRNLATDRLPQVLLRGDATYQSETTAIPIPGAGIDPPPKERYETSLDLEWTVWDGGVVAARRAAERAGLSVAIAGLDAELFHLRAEVNDAFFNALALQERIAGSSLLHQDLQARLTELRARVRNGASLPGDTAVLMAEILLVEQETDLLQAERRAALSVLSSLTGDSIREDQVLALPDLSSTVGRARATLGDESGAGPSGETLPADLRIHPGFRALDAERAARERQMSVVGTRRRPSIAAFGSVSWGSPGYEQFTRDPHEYWRAGVRVRWQPWEWGRTSREIERLQVEQRLLDARERALARQLRRALEAPLRRMAALETALETDLRIIRLREEAEAQARARFAERAISAARYTDALSDVQEARIQRTLHQIERVRAQARYLVILGLDLPES